VSPKEELPVVETVTIEQPVDTQATIVPAVIEPVGEVAPTPVVSPKEELPTPVEVAPQEPIVDVPVQTPVPPATTELTPLQALEQALHQSKKEGNNTLSHLQAIGKATLEKYNVEKGSDLHKSLVTKAGELMAWFTS
jgi:hypothetical protein